MLNSTTIRFCTDIFGFVDTDDADTENDSDSPNEIVDSTRKTDLRCVFNFVKIKDISSLRSHIIE